MSDAPGPATPRPYRRPDSWMLDLLPPWMLTDDLFRRFASVFQELATSWLEHADQLAAVFDPDLAPLPMVQQLARWIGVDGVDPELPDDRQRALVREVGALCRRQGTARRLVRVLELATDATVEVHDAGGVVSAGDPSPSPGVLRIELGSDGRLGIGTVAELVRREVPASTVFEIVVDGERRWPPPVAPDAAAGQAAGGPVTCPVCGSACARPGGAMTADEFCAVCDYPVFWAVDGVAGAAPIVGSRRVRTDPPPLPIAPPPRAGSAEAPTVVCPECRQVVELPPSDPPDAACFCSSCDFPLFWMASRGAG